MNNFAVICRSSRIGHVERPPVYEFETREEARAKAKRLNKLRSIGERKYYKLLFRVKERGVK